MSDPVAAGWTLADVPDQAGRTAVVTGPSLGGLGHHTALELARRGARVVLAGRTESKLDQTSAAITAEVPAAVVETLVVDLADLASVRRAVARAVTLGPVHLLVNNAGVMATPHRRTVDGFELQLATNHWGPFLLTGLLLPQLAASEGAVVTTVSSLAHRAARRAPLGDPRAEPRRYSRWAAYSSSKLANLLFTAELDRRCREAGVPVRATAAHPGASATHLVSNGPGSGRAGRRGGSILDAASRAVFQSPASGALPTLMAATADLPGGAFCGPRGMGELSGPPQVVATSRIAQDPGAAAALWELSEETTGLPYP